MANVVRSVSRALWQRPAWALVLGFCTLASVIQPGVGLGPTAVPCDSIDGARDVQQPQDGPRYLANWCCADVEVGPYGTLEWPPSPPGLRAMKLCPYGGKDEELEHGFAYATRMCGYQVSTRTSWRESDYSHCKRKNEKSAAENAEEAADLTDDTMSITNDTFNKAFDLIEGAFDIALQNHAVANTMLRAMSNLVATRSSVPVDKEVRRKLFARIEEFGRQVLIQNETRYEARKANLHLHVHKLPRDFDAGDDLAFNVDYDDGDTTGVSVRLPGEVLRQARDNNPGLENADLRVRFMAIRNARLLRPPGLMPSAVGQQQIVTVSISSDPASSVMMRKTNATEMSTPTLGDTPVLKDLSVENLETPVVIQMPFATWGVSHICAYFHEGDKVWKYDGVKIQITGSQDQVQCNAYHLTPFTLLLDPYPRRNLEAVAEALNLIGYLGSTLSVLGLTATIITYSFFSRFQADRWGRVLVQLCTSLGLLHVAYLASNFKGVVPPEGCTAIAVFLHLFVLSSFCWMLVEALLMYQLLITVFQDAHSKFILKRLIFAWGVPAVIVVTCWVVDRRYYFDTHPDYCVVSGANWLQHILVLVVPCSLIIIVNVFIFARISHVLLRRRRAPGLALESSDQSPITWAQVRGVVGVGFLLGITWSLSPLAFNSPTLQIMSSVLNSMQGVAIFLSRVLTHPDARRSWRHRWYRIFPKIGVGMPDFRSSSASYPVSEKGSLWSRLRRSVISESVATPLKETKQTIFWCFHRRKSDQSPRTSISPAPSKSTSETDILY